MPALNETQTEVLRDITNNGTDNYWAGYSYVKAVVEDQVGSADFVFWLEKAGEINSNNSDSLANTFIRAVSRYGLMIDGSVDSNINLQINSNLIGASVITDLLNGGEIPPLNEVIDKDVQAAISGGGQTIGGWGGSFFYWDFPYTGSSGASTVGGAIRADAYEYEKFITASAMAAVETVNKHGLDAVSLFEYLTVGASAQLPLDLKIKIMDRMLNPIGDPNAIDLYGNGPSIVQVYEVSPSDGIGRWFEIVGGTDRNEVTDSAELSLLNQIRADRIALAADTAFNTVNPDLGPYATGGLDAILDDSQNLLNVAEISPDSFASHQGAQTSLAELATWYAERLISLGISDPGGNGILTVENTSTGLLEIEFSTVIQGIIDQALPGGSAPTEEEKLAPRSLALETVYQALALDENATDEEKEILDQAITVAWGNLDGAPTETAAKRIEYFAFEARNGQDVTIHALTRNEDDLGSALVGGNGADTIDGKSKDDILIGRHGNDIINGAEGADIIFGGEGADTIQGGEGGDYINGGDGNDFILAGKEPDQDTPELPSGLPPTTDDVENDIILAGDGNDTVVIGGGEDLISLGDGDDTIIITTHEAKTVIWGGAGADTYDFRTDGIVVFVDLEGVTEENFSLIDTQKLFAYLSGSENPPSYVIVNAEASDRILVNGVELGHATVERELWYSYQSDQEVVYTDTGLTEDGLPVYKPSSLEQEYYEMYINGFKFEADSSFSNYLSYVGGYSDGHNVLSLGTGLGIIGFKEGDLGLSFQNSGLTPYLEEFDWTTSQDINLTGPWRIRWEMANDTIRYEYWPEDWVEVGEPETVLETDENGYARPEGWDGRGHFLLNIDDVLINTEEPYDPGAPSYPLDATGTGSGEAIGGSSSGDEIHSLGGGDTIYGYGGDDILDGGDGADIIFGGDGDDALMGGEGADQLYGGAGDDWFDGGSGDDTIDGGAGSLDSVDYIGTLSDFTFTRQQDGSVTVTSVTGGVDTLLNIEQLRLFDQDLLTVVTYSLDEIVPALPGGQTILGTVGDDDLNGGAYVDTLIGGTGDDLLSGGGGSDSYLYAQGDGYDTIVETQVGFSDVDKVIFTDVGPTAISLISSGTDLIIDIAGSAPGASDAGSIVIVGMLDPDADKGIESITFSDGSSWEKSDINLFLQLGYVATVQGTLANDTLAGGWNDDVLRGKGGDDLLLGGAGSDIYIYSTGDGSDYIDDEAGFTNNTDVLVLTDLNANDVSFSKDGVHLVISINGSSQSITIDEQFYSEVDYWGVERIDFADGVSWDRNEILAAVSTPEVPVATLIGTLASETLTGTADDDVIWGKTGDDLLLGSAGSDIYIYALGDGNDYIDDEAGFTTNTDVLLLTNLNADDISLSQDGVHLLITIDSSGDIITIDEQFYSEIDYWGIERIDFANGSSLSRAQILDAVA